MSGVRTQLDAQLRNFDDDAFEALANRGLLRRARKDLEKSPAVLLEETAEALTLSVGEHRVRMDARGPAHATCTCPALGVCQHILAAALQLKADTVSGTQEKAPAESPTAEPVANDGGPDPLRALHDELSKISMREMVTHCGKAGYRWAWRFLHDLPDENDVNIGGERHIIIAFKRPRMTFRYMGGGLGNIIADAQITQLEKYRVAAALAYQRAHQVPIHPPEERTTEHTEALNLGKDHAAPTAGSLEDSRARLRASTKQLITECIELGLSHLSPGIQERFTTLSVWAQGAEYYRLALSLRRLADHVELLLDRAGGADEHRLLDELTIAYALVIALDNVSDNTAPYTRLVGQARSRYTQAGTLELLGLGASAWRSASGYVGLTMLFWSVTDLAFLSCTDARPAIQRGFNPVARYKAAGPWSGLGAPLQTTGQRVLLTNAQVNSVGRIAASDSAAATIQSCGDFAAHLKPCKHWSALSQLDAPAARSLLAEPQPMNRWVALQPSRFGAPIFDPTNQAMTWPVYDESEQQLDLVLRYSDYTAHAIQRIELLSADTLAPHTLVIAQVRRGQSGFVAEPLSLVDTAATSDRNPVDALFFDPAPTTSIASKWLARLRRGTTQEAPANQNAVVIMPAGWRELRHWLQRQAERGATRDRNREMLQELGRLIERTRRDGFMAFPSISAEGDAPWSERLLKSHYLCLQYEQLLDSSSNTVN